MILSVRSKTGRCPTFLCSVGKTPGEIRTRISAEKTRIIPFSSTIKPGKTSFDFLGFEFSMGKRPKREATCNAAHSSQEPEKFAETLQGMVQGKPKFKAAGVVQTVECQATRALQLLRSNWQLPEPGTVLLPSQKVAV